MSAYKRALELQKVSIGDIIGRAMQIFSSGKSLASTSATASANGEGLSFASARVGASNEETLSVKINVLPESPLSSKITPQIENLENKRADQEQSSVDQMKLDISGALDFFL